MNYIYALDDYIDMEENTRKIYPLSSYELFDKNLLCKYAHRVRSLECRGLSNDTLMNLKYCKYINLSRNQHRFSAVQKPLSDYNGIVTLHIRRNTRNKMYPIMRLRRIERIIHENT